MQRKNRQPVNKFLNVVLELQYLPPLPYFSAILKSDKVIFETHENFIRQTYRNRCTILTSQGAVDLVIPLKKPQQHVPVTEIKIDNRQKWALRHWKAIQSAYGKAPWFGHYQNELKENLLTEKQYLVEFNLTIIGMCFSFLGYKIMTENTSRYIKNYPENYLDLRSRIHPKKDMNSLSFYSPVKYIQNFGREFVHPLSVIDLIFSEGPESLNVIKETAGLKNHKLN